MAPIEGKHHDIYSKINPLSPDSGLAETASNRTVIITGAGRGIGRGIALSYAAASAQLIVIAARTISELDEVESAIKKVSSSTNVIKHVTNITDEDSVKSLIDAAVEASPLGTPFTLINNAGTGEPVTKMINSDPKTWFNTWEVNIKSVYLPTRFLLPHLSKSANGKNYIINISSIGSRVTLLGFSAYQASKTGVNRFTDFLHQEHSEEFNMVTFAVHPGGVMTKLAKDLMPAEYHGFLVDTPELIGGFSVWLGSGKCDWASGRYLECDWDVNDILSRREEVEGGDLWKTIVVM